MDHTKQEAGDADEAKLTRDWLNQLLDEIEALEPVVPKLVPDDGPEWAHRLEDKIGGAVCPVPGVRDGMLLRPEVVGGFLGHLCGLQVYAQEVVNFHMDEVEAWLSKLPKEITEKAAEAAESPDEFSDRLTTITRRALGSCVDLPYEAMSGFLTGFAKAFARKPRTMKVGDLGRSNFEVQNYMLHCWRIVDRLGSVAELHAFLVKKFGPARTGTLKRVEKLCSEIGLVYRGRGRPRKSESQGPVR